MLYSLVTAIPAWMGKERCPHGAEYSRESEMKEPFVQNIVLMARNFTGLVQLWLHLNQL